MFKHPVFGNKVDNTKIDQDRGSSHILVAMKPTAAMPVSLKR